MFKIFSERYKALPGVPISRITGQRSNMNIVVKTEIDYDSRNPEGILGRLMKNSKEFNASGRFLTSERFPICLNLSTF